MAKGGLARQRFQEKQQRNRIVAQLNQLRGQGFSQEQIRAAGPNAFQALSQQVVTDTDTLESLASSAGVDPTNILDANPELKNLQTGQVINVPRPGSPEWRDRGGIGLPSNAALGSTTNNPQGVSMWAGTTPGYNQQQRPNTWQSNQTNIASGNPFANSQYRPPVATGSVYVPPGLSQQQRTQVPQSPQTPTTPPRPTVAQPPTGLPSTYPGGFRRWAGEEMAQINSPGYTPNAMTLKVLETAGLIQKSTPAPSFGGGGFSRRRGGGGGGGGRQPRLPGVAPTPQERLPAFSSGGGFNGLVNWRI
jgi:LysM repeat protein